MTHMKIDISWAS